MPKATIHASIDLDLAIHLERLSKERKTSISSLVTKAIKSRYENEINNSEATNTNNNITQTPTT